MQISIWTSFYIDLNPIDAIIRCADLGWRVLEISAEHGEFATKNSDWQEQLEHIRRLCEDRNVKLYQMHSPLRLDVADLSPDNRKSDIETVVKWIEYSHVLGILNLIIHPGGKHGSRSEEADQIFDLNVDAFSYLADFAEKFNVYLCIENMQERENKDTKRFGAFICDINELIDTIGSDHIGICFDTSHANVTRLNMYQAIQECGNRLLATHISDNDGSGDQHNIPFNGNINWTDVISALKNINYKSAFNLEIPGESRIPMKPLMIPLEIRDAKLRYSMEVLAYILSLE
ncbi:MAG: sugar phosphate isomerase/epimerase family protein [bacterium]